jgi:hypothetical protein
LTGRRRSSADPGASRQYVTDDFPVLSGSPSPTGLARLELKPLNARVWKRSREPQRLRH